MRQASGASPERRLPNVKGLTPSSADRYLREVYVANGCDEEIVGMGRAGWRCVGQDGRTASGAAAQGGTEH